MPPEIQIKQPFFLIVTLNGNNWVSKCIDWFCAYYLDCLKKHLRPVHKIKQAILTIFTFMLKTSDAIWDVPVLEGRRWFRPKNGPKIENLSIKIKIWLAESKMLCLKGTPFRWKFLVPGQNSFTLHKSFFCWILCVLDFMHCECDYYVLCFVILSY